MTSFASDQGTKYYQHVGMRACRCMCLYMCARVHRHARVGLCMRSCMLVPSAYVFFLCARKQMCLFMGD